MLQLCDEIVAGDEHFHALNTFKLPSFDATLVDQIAIPGSILLLCLLLTLII